MHRGRLANWTTRDGLWKTSGELEEIYLLGVSSVKPPQFSWGTEGGRLKLNPLWLPPFISSFCNWMHVSITEYYCPFSSYGLRDTQGLGRLRAPPQWTCKWRPAELLWRGVGRRALQPLGGLQDTSENTKSFQGTGVVGRAERGTESIRKGPCLCTWKDRLPFPQGALGFSTSLSEFLATLWGLCLFFGDGRIS